MVRRDVVQNSDQYDSEKEFCETAIRRQAPQIVSLASEENVIRELIGLLNSIDGMNESYPEFPTEALIKDEALSSAKVSIHLTEQDQYYLNEVIDHTGMDRAEVIRRCIFKQLFELSQGSNLLKGWQERCVVRTWTSLKNDLLRPKTLFNEIVHRRFTLLYEETMQLISRDEYNFRDFAEEYEKEFYQSGSYDEILEMYGERPFVTLENLIEEYTDMEFESGLGANPFL